MHEDPKAAGTAVTCVVCGQRKQPTGRSAPVGSYLCDWDCPGYACQPLPGSLWPGETREDFGFPCDTAADLVGIGPVYETP